MEGTKFIEKYFFLGLLIASAVLVLIILFPFLTILILGVAFAVVFDPVYEWIRKKIGTKSNWIPALITVILFLIVLCGPLLLLGSVVFNQFENLYIAFTSATDGGPMLNAFGHSLRTFLPTGFAIDIQREIGTVIGSLSNNIKDFFTATLNTIFMFILAVLTMFYFLKDGHALKKAFIHLSPLEVHHTEKLLSKLGTTINGIIKGYLVIAVAQGLLMGIGLAIFDVPHPALWGVVSGVASLVPMIGTAFVAIPTVIYLLMMGSTGNAIGLAIWALALVGTIDNFLNPLIIGKQTDLPPLLILFSVLGGVVIMGPIGVLIGPLAVSLLFTLVSMYRENSTV